MHAIAGYNQSKNVRINLLSCMRIHSATLQDMTFIAAIVVFLLRFVTFFSSWSWAVLGHLYSQICFTENLVMTFGLIFGLTFAGTFDRMSFSCTARIISVWLVDACPKSLFWNAVILGISCIVYSTHAHYYLYSAWQTSVCGMIPKQFSVFLHGFLSFEPCIYLLDNITQ